MNNEIVNKIKEEIEDLKPFLNMDGGDIEFIKYEDNIVFVRLTGACANCGLQDYTLKDNIFEYLKEHIAEIEGIVNVTLWFFF